MITTLDRTGEQNPAYDGLHRLFLLMIVVIVNIQFSQAST
jgi:hypothetical protein